MLTASTRLLLSPLHGRRWIAGAGLDPKIIANPFILYAWRHQVLSERTRSGLSESDYYPLAVIHGFGRFLYPTVTVLPPDSGWRISFQHLSLSALFEAKSRVTPR